jgi:hypothetical protein
MRKAMRVMILSIMDSTAAISMAPMASESMFSIRCVQVVLRDRLVAQVARVEAALAELRAEVVRVKAGVDGDVFLWV